MGEQKIIPSYVVTGLEVSSLEVSACVQLQDVFSQATTPANKMFLLLAGMVGTKEVYQKHK